MKYIYFLIILFSIIGCKNKEKNIDVLSKVAVDDVQIVREKNILPSQDFNRFWNPYLSGEIHYPYFSDKELNAIISDYVNNIIYNIKDKNRLNLKCIRYEITFENKYIISILFSIFFEYSGKDYEGSDAIILDKNKKKIIKFSDIFDLKDNATIAAIKEFILNDRLFINIENDESLIRWLNGDDENFPIQIFLTKDDLIIILKIPVGAFVEYELDMLKEYLLINLDNPQKPYTKTIDTNAIEEIKYPDRNTIHIPYFDDEKIDKLIFNEIIERMNNLKKNEDISLGNEINLRHQLIGFTENSVSILFILWRGGEGNVAYMETFRNIYNVGG